MWNCVHVKGGTATLLDNTKVQFEVGKDSNTGKLRVTYHLDVAQVQQRISEKGNVTTGDLGSHMRSSASGPLFQFPRNTTTSRSSQPPEAGPHVDAFSSSQPPEAGPRLDAFSSLHGHDTETNVSSGMPADSLTFSSPHSESIASIKDLVSSPSTPVLRCPAFEHQSIVEYYSERASCWVHAKLEVNEHGTSELVYSATLLTAKRQRRDGVALASLRTPIRVGELVLAYIPDEDIWLNAIIHRSPAPQSGRNIVYVVRITSSKGVRDS